MLNQLVQSAFVLSIAVVAGVATSLSAPGKQSGSTWKDDSGKYILHGRGYIFTRQLLFTVLQILSVIRLTDLLQISVRESEEHLQREETVSVLLEMSVILLSHLLDGVNLIRCVQLKICWLVVYSCMSVTYIDLLCDSQSLLNISMCVCYSVGTISTLLEVVYPLYEYQENVPTAEYTCDLWSYMSFSFLNEILIVSLYWIFR